MRVVSHRFLVFSLLVPAVLLLSSCSLIKVREDWDPVRNPVIPLDDARNAWNEIRDGRIPGKEALEEYNDAVLNSVVQIAENWESGERALSVIETSDGPIRIGVEALNLRNIQTIDQVIPAEFIRVKKGFDSQTLVNGVGTPLLVRQRRVEADPMIPETGVWYPISGILNFDQPNRPVLQLIDPTREPYLPFQGSRIPLSVNYTASLARDFEDRQNLLPNAPALLRFEKYAERMGMYRISAFDPEKQVCILVHGINSSPMTWHKFLNSAYADPQVRARYEFWTFGYPTGASIPYLASEFRESIGRLLEFRARNSARDSNLVIVGHSMGGLLAKAVTQHGGEQEWNRLFTVPIEELKVSEEDREVMRKMVYYRPIPEVERVVLCAVPHRGSRLAKKPGVRLISSLVQVPEQLAEVTKDILKQSSYVLTPEGFELAKKNLSSVDQLRPASRVTAEFLNKPLNPGVKFYSVIGSKVDRPLPLEETTDGVVDYTSSHIEGVISEKVILDSPHGVHRTPGGVAEIIRILRLP